MAAAGGGEADGNGPIDGPRLPGASKFIFSEISPARSAIVYLLDVAVQRMQTSQVF